MLAKKTLELNPHHPVMRRLLESVKENDGEIPEGEEEYAKLLFHMAMLNSGFQVEDPSVITVPLERLVKVGFGFDRDMPVEEIEIDLEEEETEEEPEEDDEDVEGDAEVEDLEGEEASPDVHDDL